MRPETRYARTPDGIYIAYQTIGDGPIDLVWQFEWIGNVDTIWECRPYASWLEGLASFSRVILHDRRGTGASSRNVEYPNLETRVADLRVVLDEVGADRPVLAGALEGGAPNVLFAATDPERVQSVVWWYPAPRTERSADYPFGATAEFLEEGTRDTERHWGTEAYDIADMFAFGAKGDAVPWGWLSRQTATPDVALQMDRIYNETDVRDAMGAITAPVLLMARERDREALTYLATLLRRPEVRLFPGEDALQVDEQPAVLDAVRAFVGVEPARPELDTFLSTVLLTDIVGSTQQQAAAGDRRWRGVIERHHAIVREALDRWNGVERDTAGDGFYATFDGPARAIRCALEIGTRVQDLGIEIRAGVHTGECELIDGKVGGIAVAIGARVSALAGASEVLVSQTVKDLVAGSGLTFRERGEHELKGVPDTWRLYAVT
ncbi:MAG TPA: adenylate/guanylate cyclase domain-containing protein [Actinomycetota bacterium]|nr:adenylate/guanylate cyclase domain-containing protein [Actinomycetota bacterium]